MKECSKCWKVKPLSEFYKNKRNPDGLQPTCKKCATKATTAHKRQTVSKCSQLEYDTLFVLQAGKCAICGKHNSDLKRNLAADHCHTTNKVRGLLCSTCNMGLGYFKDSQTLLLEAIAYLNRSQ